MNKHVKLEGMMPRASRQGQRGRTPHLPLCNGLEMTHSEVEDRSVDPGTDRGGQGK